MLLTDSASDTTKVALPAVAVVLAALITAAVSWARYLSASASRLRAVDEATKTVRFWESWQRSLSSLPSDETVYRMRAVHHIQEAGGLLEPVHDL
jgi:hypothetical protein